MWSGTIGGCLFPANTVGEKRCKSTTVPNSLLGEDDLLIIVELPGIEWAIQVSIAISKMSGIAFRTVPAVTVEKFDAIMTR